LLIPAEKPGSSKQAEGDAAMSDVQEQNYATVIREMIRHENDVTNHRIMWLLIVQGLLFNAYFSAGQEGALIVTALPPMGILVALSAFVMLYKSYHARGYLLFLGNEAKQGRLREENLPLVGWPKKRVNGWWRGVWVCPWLEQAGDVLEPWLFLPGLLVCMWLFILLHQWAKLNVVINSALSALLAAMIISVYCILWVGSQGKGKERIE
jgi:hypothetical protein